MKQHSLFLLLVFIYFFDIQTTRSNHKRQSSLISKKIAHIQIHASYHQPITELYTSESSLIEAIMDRNKYRTCAWLINKQRPPNFSLMPYENTPLMKAVDQEDIANVQLLLKHGAEKNRKNIWGETVLLRALELYKNRKESRGIIARIIHTLLHKPHKTLQFETLEQAFRYSQKQQHAKSLLPEEFPAHISIIENARSWQRKHLVFILTKKIKPPIAPDNINLIAQMAYPD